LCAAANTTSRKDPSGTFPQAYRNDEHGKLLLMAPGYDRSGGVGFRCVSARAEFAHSALENLFDVSPDAIFVTDSQGVIRGANPRAANSLVTPRLS
jgi:PAS domain-containing protein